MNLTDSTLIDGEPSGISGSDPPPAAAPPFRTLSTFASQALLCLYQHRLMSTGQLRRLLSPGIGPRARYPQRQLALLRGHGLADAVSRGASGELLWFVTSAGAALAEHSGAVRPRSYRMDALRAAGPLQNHTLAVNEVGLAFAATARRHGHECQPLDWICEPAHRLTAVGRPQAEQYLIPDALLHYLVADPVSRSRSQLQFFVEVDRATMSVSRLAGKLTQYARYHDLSDGGRSAADGRPAWRHRYPRFPRLLIVLDGGTPAQLAHRTLDLIAHVNELPRMRQHRPGLTAGITTLRQLQECGPLEEIFTPLTGGPPVDVFLNPGEAA